jgi:NAD(P)-dependent dehydrogenase (short-subunit alcohol dehydrogenase family)
MNMLLEKKNAVIYGAGGAVGGAVARAFAREGARVFLAGHSRAPIEAVAQEISQAGGVAEAALVDALDALAVEKHLSEVVKKTGGIDISFNAIGIGHLQGTPLVEKALEEFTRPIVGAMQTQFLTTTAAAQHMIRRDPGDHRPPAWSFPTSAASGSRVQRSRGSVDNWRENWGLMASVSSVCARLVLRIPPEWARPSAFTPSMQAFPRRRSRPVLRRERC